MKALTHAHLAARDLLCARLTQHYGALGDALQRATDTFATTWERIEAILAAYNAVVDEANAWREEIASEIQATIEERSEKWQASETGQAYLAWVTAWENDTLETIALDVPEMPDLEVDDQSDVLAGLPEDPH